VRYRRKKFTFAISSPDEFLSEYCVVNALYVYYTSLYSSIF